jgi:hypothetical protein
MAINFPDPPLTTGQTFTASQRTWTWNGRAWQASTTTSGYTGSAGVNGYAGSIGYTGSAPTTIPLIEKFSNYTLQLTDNGSIVSITTGGITVPPAVFSAGMNITIFNNSLNNQVITPSGLITMYLAGMAVATTGNRTIAPYGLATIICIAPTIFTITGAGVI